MLKPSGRTRAVQAAIRQAANSFNQSDTAKDACRLALVSDSLWEKPPTTIFALGGPHLHDVAVFRAKWGARPRIISLERQRKAAQWVDQSKVELLIGTVHSYVGHAELPMGIPAVQRLFHRPSRVPGSTEQIVMVEPLTGFDFPTYDLAYLDYTEFPKPETLAVTARFIDEHMAENGVVGVTFNLSRPQDHAWTPHGLAHEVQQRVRRPVTKLDAQTYTIRCPMAFLLFRVS